MTSSRAPADGLYGDVYPASWYAVAPSRGLARGEIRPLELFGRDFVLYRTRAGQAHVVGRYCPHQGASFQTGAVRGERLVCPFHHWEYEAGRCVHIPYADRIPPRAEVERLPVREHLGWLWVFNGDEPTFELPDLPELHDRVHYGTRALSQRFDVHPLLILENGCDAQHFKYVHDVQFVSLNIEVQREEPHRFSFRVHQELRGLGGGYRLTTEIDYVGPTVIFGRLSFDDRERARFIAAPLPLARGRTLFHLVVATRRLPWFLWALEPLWQSWFARRLFKGSTDDYLPIWRFMNTAHRRVLVADDALQQKYRRFYGDHLPPGTLTPPESAHAAPSESARPVTPPGARPV